MLFGKFKVSGHSMEPAIKSGQEILVSSIPYFFKNLKIQDVVAFKERGKFIVKRIKEIKNGKFLMQGDNKKDSKDFGLIEEEAVLGKVIHIFK